MDWNNIDLEKLVHGTVTQPGLNTYVFEEAYNKAGIAYSYEFGLFAITTYGLSQKLSRKISILEVGVGTGRVGAFLHQLPWVNSYLGIDTEPSAIDLCNTRHPNLPVRLQNLLLIPPPESWDIVVMPFGTFSGIAENRQEIMFLKMIHHSNHITLIDTMIPEAFGATEDTYYENNGQELGLSIEYLEWFASLKTYACWVTSYNKHAKEATIAITYAEYPFSYSVDKPIQHQLVRIEKTLRNNNT